MKVAIIHEWLVIVGGAEKVLKAMLDVFPDADVYTLVAKKEICDELGLKWNKVHTSFIQKNASWYLKDTGFIFPYFLLL